MSNTSRIVRHLRLRAAGESAIHRAALLIEDALRTASLPDACGRIVLVRRLALGRIDTRAAPQTVALELERAVARLTRECVYAGAVSADRAPAVWFRDALDAHARLALRLAAGIQADAWYWPLAVPAWRAQVPLLESLRRIVLSLASLPEAPTALPLWAAAMSGAGHAGRLIAALRVEDVEPLARAAALRVPALAGMDPCPARGTPEPGADPHTPMGPGAVPATAFRAAPSPPAEHRLQPMDLRWELVRALLRAAGAPAARTIAPSLPLAGPGPSHWSGGRGPGDASVAQDPRPAGKAERRAAGTPRVRSAYGGAAKRGRAGGEKTSAPAALATATEMRSAPRAMASGPRQAGYWDGSGDDRSGAVPPLRAQDDGAPGSAPAPPWTAPDTITLAGGLLFLIPVLQRLGYPEWLEDQPEWARFDVARRVLALVLTRMQVADEDPAWRLAFHRGGAGAAPRRFVAPARWRKEPCTRDGGLRAIECDGTRTLWDASGRLLLGAWSGHGPRALMREWRIATPHPGGGHPLQRADLVTNAWLIAARRWLRRVAGIGLADLVPRPAALALTPTHADLGFEMGVAELRIRRAGLDLDPGWVPWYGRVVTFRYHN